MFHHLQTSDPRLLAALVRLTATPEGQEVLSWFEKMHGEQLKSLLEIDEPRQLQQLQGAARFLAELLEVIRTAKPVLEKVKTSQRS